MLDKNPSEQEPSGRREGESVLLFVQPHFPLSQRYHVINIIRTYAFQHGTKCPTFRLVHFSIGGAGQDAPPTVRCVSLNYITIIDLDGQICCLIDLEF